MEKFDLYRDIRTRTNGEIYVGIVGPVRTGKSTFARKFIEQIVLPVLEEPVRSAARDEMPASGSGKTITTVEPKFIPQKAVSLPLSDGSTMSVRLVDCVGFPVPGAEGTMEDGNPRMVKTPWKKEPVPLSEAAKIGTEKVITDHATIGLVITADGSFGDIPGEQFQEAEKQTITQLQKLGKPFVVIVNSARPDSAAAQSAAERIAASYGVYARPYDCERLTAEDIRQILSECLLEFPLVRVAFRIPGWVELLAPDHWLKQSLFDTAKTAMKGLHTVRDMEKADFVCGNPYIKQAKSEHTNLSDGSADIVLSLQDTLYYEILSEMTGAEIHSEYQLISLISEISEKKREYDCIAEALQSTRQTGYGVIRPSKDEIVIKEPSVIRQGNRYGIKITAEAPSIHLLRSEVITELSPIVGSEEQAKDLIAYIKENEKTEEGAWSTLIFGKSIEQMVEDGIRAKLLSVNEDCQAKLQNAMKRIVNDSKGKLFILVL
ncbi:MAG: stage IV sporulation protein A [Lachnospiraceae bacterium]|nr:stage IV sporulation protein A [Lachnospiraceae bacterium]